MNATSCRVDDLHRRLGFAEPPGLSPESRGKALVDWKMEVDDAPIFQYLYRHHRPKRHLEFGTWLGTGATYCLEECDATVWTINLLDGETNSDGSWVYLSDYAPGAGGQPSQWANSRTTRSGRMVCQTDSLGFIGSEYRKRGLGHRVCQIYCDSTKWDTSNYSPGFFDSVLIDGGHTEAVVTSDTQKALSLLRPGGLVLWHDYCPDEAVRRTCDSVRGVLAAIENNHQWLTTQLADLFWVEPSWILVGVKR